MPIFIDILKLHEKAVDWLLGDFLTEDAGRVLTRSLRVNDVIKDTIEEMRNWACFSKSYEKREKMHKSNLKSQANKSSKFRSTNIPAVKGIKIDRNDPCSCGSGKKYKSVVEDNSVSQW